MKARNEGDGSGVEALVILGGEELPGIGVDHAESMGNWIKFYTLTDIVST